MSERSRRVVELAARLDTAEHPLPGHELPADPAVRTALNSVLSRRGRTIVHVDTGGDAGEVTTGLADAVAEQLAAAGIGILTQVERATLALVLLRCVAEPTAAGRPPTAWHQADRVKHEVLGASQLPYTHVQDGLRSLTRAGLVDAAPGPGVRPGPALARLTPQARQTLERQMVELVAADDPLIQRVLANMTSSPATTAPAAVDSGESA